MTDPERCEECWGTVESHGDDCPLAPERRPVVDRDVLDRAFRCSPF